MPVQDKALKENQIYTDRRTFGQIVSDVVRSPSVRGYLYLLITIFLFAAPQLLPVYLLILCPALFSDRRIYVPLRIPKEAKVLDPSDPIPTKPGFSMARGEVYLGNDRNSDAEAWVSWSDQRYHDYVMGSTGSGKTETILAINANYVLALSGFIIGDGKGTMLFPKQTATLARLGGADDDHFVLSFLSGYKQRIDRSQDKLSNSFNPFGEGGAPAVKEILTSLMSNSGGDNAIFAEGAASLAESMAPAWVEGREKKLWSLDIRLIGSTLNLKKMIELTQNGELSNEARANIKAFLQNLSYDFDKAPNKQEENVTRMFGYYVNYFTRVITSFSIGYRNIFVTRQGDTNIRDVVRSRRCLVFTLPPLEKSPTEVKTLGNILFSSCKTAASLGLGVKMEGTREESLYNLMGNRRVPYKFNFDEIAFYILEGFSLMPAQLRGINISNLIGAQDYAGTTRAGEIEAQSMFSNARLKLFGALEDVSTWQKLKDVLGEIDVPVYSRLINKGNLFGRFIPDMDVSITRRLPVRIEDLQSQVEGQFHTFMRGKLSAIQTYYPNIRDDNVLDNQRLIRLVPCPTPKAETLKQNLRLIAFLDMMSNTDQVFMKSNWLTRAASKMHASVYAPTEKAMGTLLAFYDKVQLASSSQPPAPSEILEIQENSAGDTDEPVSDFQAIDDDMPIVEHQPTSTSSAAQWIEDYQRDYESENEPSEAPLPNQEATTNEEEDLLAESANAWEQINLDDSSFEGVYGLTNTEFEEINERYRYIEELLGVPEDDSEAGKVIESIKKSVFYLVPPKPAPEKHLASRIKRIVERMEQGDFFDGTQTDS